MKIIKKVCKDKYGIDAAIFKKKKKKTVKENMEEIHIKIYMNKINKNY